MGNYTQVEVEGKGNVELDNDIFKDVLHVLNLSTNLLSIYHITHYGCDNKVEFLPDTIVVKNLKDDSMVVVGKIIMRQDFILFVILCLSPLPLPC